MNTTLKSAKPSLAKIAFLERAQNAIQRLADEMSEDMLERALAAGSDVGTIARVISNPQLNDPALLIDPLAPSRARALQHRREVAKEAGAMLSASEASSLLNISRQALDKRRNSGAVLAVRVGSDWKYPELQFQESSPLSRLKDIIKAHHGVDGWVILDSIIGVDHAYRNRSIMDLLREGDDSMIDQVLIDLEEQYAP